MTPSPVAEARDVYRAAFERFAEDLGRADVPWLRAARTAAIARFTERGFPTRHDEAWRYTSVAAIARTSFVRPQAVEVTSDAVAAIGFGGLPARRVVFVNGRHAPGLSTPLPRGIEVRPLREVLASQPERACELLTRVAGDDENVFVSLNTAFLEDGAFVSVAPGAVVAEPVAILFYGDGEKTASYPRNLVLAGRGSQAALVEAYGGADGSGYLACPVTEVALQDGAILEHVTLVREGDRAFHVGCLAVTQGRDSRFTAHSLSLAGALIRNDLDVALAGEGAECTLNGLFMAAGEQLVDNHTLIVHATPHCSSRELYKGVLDGHARGVFHGKIVVEAGAQKTDAWQTNKNLLLSREALVNSTPALQILADDVKCKHGSTTGQIDPMALFYMRSRGIGEVEARSLLAYAFASDVVHRLGPAELREALERHLQARLSGASEPPNAGGRPPYAVAKEAVA